MHYTFSLFEPGKRKGYKFWLAVVRVGRESFEIRTGETSKAAARRAAQDAGKRLVAELEAEQSRPLKAGELTTFREAADAYLAYRQNPKIDTVRLARICLRLGPLPIGEISGADLHAAANVLMPDAKPATKNREVVRPAATVLHYAADNSNGTFAWLRIKQFKEARPQTRAVSTDAASALIANAEDPDLKLLLIWLFHQGNRISEALSVEWEHLDLPAATLRVYIAKIDEWRLVDLDPAVVVALGNVPPEQQVGRVFYRWKYRWSVYKPIRKLAARLGIVFTPHMARHSMATWANAAGLPTKTIMEMGNWRDVKSVLRYTGSDIKTVRAARTKMPRLAG
jgi:integrase